MDIDFNLIDSDSSHSQEKHLDEAWEKRQEDFEDSQEDLFLENYNIILDKLDTFRGNERAFDPRKIIPRSIEDPVGYEPGSHKAVVDFLVDRNLLEYHREGRVVLDRSSGLHYSEKLEDERKKILSMKIENEDMELNSSDIGRYLIELDNENLQQLVEDALPVGEFLHSVSEASTVYEDGLHFEALKMFEGVDLYDDSSFEVAREMYEDLGMYEDGEINIEERHLQMLGDLLDESYEFSIDDEEWVREAQKAYSRAERSYIETIDPMCSQPPTR